MEKRLEIVLNEIFLNYGFLFDKKSDLEYLVSDITDRYLESVRLDVSIFNTYLMEIESRVRKCLALKIKENPFKVLNSYINKNLSNAKNNIEALDSISYLCDISGYKISNVMIKELLSNNKVLNKLVSSAVKDNMIYLKNNNLGKKVSNEVTKEFIYTYCDLENIDVNEINPTSKYPYFGYDLPPFKTVEEELEVVNRAKMGDKSAKEELILRNIKLINNVAIKYLNTIFNIDDLTQEGIIGLLTAIEKYDSSKKIKFSTYANYWIKANILGYIKTKGNAIKIGGSDTTLYTKYLKFQESFSNKYGRVPTLAEAALELDVGMEHLEMVINSRKNNLSLDEYVYDEDKEATMADFIPDESIDIEADAEDLELKENINTILNNIGLSDKEKIVVYLRFGFDGSGTICPRKRIADYLGLSQQRVGQIEESAKKRIINSKIFKDLIADDSLTRTLDVLKK